MPSGESFERNAVFLPGSTDCNTVPMIKIAGCTVATFIDSTPEGLRLRVSIGVDDAHAALVQDEGTDDEQVRMRIDVNMTEVFQD